MSNELVMPCEFEITPFLDDLRFDMSAVVFEVRGPEDRAPTTVIGDDQRWGFEVTLTIAGGLARHLCGEWCVCAYLESIGPGEEYMLDLDPQSEEDCLLIPMDPCGNGVYPIRVEFPAGRIATGRCGRLYLFSISVVALDACGKPGHISGHCKGPTLMFYEGTPHEDDD